VITGGIRPLFYCLTSVALRVILKESTASPPMTINYIPSTTKDTITIPAKKKKKPTATKK